MHHKDADMFAEWRVRLLDEGIMDADGKINLFLLEEAYPKMLDEEQIMWIERSLVGVDPCIDPEPIAEEIESDFTPGEVLHIIVDLEEKPEKVTVDRITDKGIYLASTKDDSVEYLVSEDELKDMVV
ncbi:MAG: hypothetical protein WC802_01280 [Patescibacteria group bacterium]|jgi:hypothetical protein